MVKVNQVRKAKKITVLGLLPQILNTDWKILNGCVCRNCTFMPTVKESTCCQEINAVEHKLHGDHEDLDYILNCSPNVSLDFSRL